MERRLVLLRHAKSSWKHEGIDDHERPLNSRGRRQAPEIARELEKRGWLPDTVWSSDAARCRETIAAIRETTTLVPPTRFDPRLYLASAGRLLELLRMLPDSSERVLVVGHNPGWSDAVGWLTGGVSVDLKTANAALLDTREESWRGAFEVEGRWRHVATLRPSS